MKRVYVDPYCYHGTDVLKNFLDIRDRDELDMVESAMTTSQGLIVQADEYRVSCDLAGLLGVHRTLFGRLFPFAGKLREHTGRMTKTRASGYAVVYCDSAFVAEQIRLVFAQLAEEKCLKGLPPEAFARRAAYFYGELDAVHPFREGNSRTLRLFFYGVAASAGYKLWWDRLGAEPGARDKLYAARDRAVMHGGSGPLAGLFASILTGG